MTISKASRRSAQADVKQPKHVAWYDSVSDWEVVRLPPVEPDPMWREYFGLEPEKAAA